MRRLFFPFGSVTVLVLCLVPAVVLSAVPLEIPKDSKAVQPSRLNSLKAFFIPNQGQIDKEVAFYMRTAGGAIFVTVDGHVVYALPQPVSKSVSIAGRDNGAVVVREKFFGTEKIAVKGVDRTQTLVNSYRGSDPGMWRRSLPTYRSLDLGTLYDDIEVRLVGTEAGIEKLFYIKPHGNVSGIRIRMEGAQQLSSNAAGQLVVETLHGPVRFTRPVAYQEVDGKKKDVQVAYQVNGNEYGFSIGKYDRTLPLIIDPLLASTYLGGSGDEGAEAVVVNGGDIVIAGSVNSADFPGLDTSVEILGDALVARLDEDLSTVVNATYFGGSMFDGIRDMVADSTTIYVTGPTSSLDFPTTLGAAYAGTSQHGAFIVRLNATSLEILASTGFYRNPYAIAHEPGGSIFVAGSTMDPLFPATEGAYLGTPQGSSDGYVARFSQDLTTLEAATLLGGEEMEIVYDLAVTSGGQPVVVGITSSIDFPVTPGAFDTSYNLDSAATYEWSDGFAARLTGDLTDLAVSTYLGGGFDDQIKALELDGDNVLVGGFTISQDFPCANIIGPAAYYDAFVVKLDNALGTAVSCAVFGGGETSVGTGDEVYGLAVNGMGDVFVTGRTTATDFPTTPGAFLSEPAGDYAGAFVSSLLPDLSSFNASTLVHGAGEDLWAITLDASGNVVVAGDAHNTGYPVTEGVVQQTPAGGSDLVISRLTADLSADQSGPEIDLDVTDIDFGEVPIGVGQEDFVTIWNIGSEVLTIAEVSLASGSSSDFSQENQCITIPSLGSCAVTVTFAPSSVGGKNGTLIVSSNDPVNSQVSVALAGTGVAVTAVTVDPDSLTFGDVDVGKASSVLYVTVTNAGVSTLVVSFASIGGEDLDDFIIVNEECSQAPVAPSGSCSISLLFNPKDSGSRIGELVIHSNDPLIPHYPVPLSGHGVGSPDIITQPNPCEFLGVSAGSTTTRKIRVWNNGNEELNIYGLTLSGRDVDQYRMDSETCTGATIQESSGGSVSDSCQIVVTFSPTSDGDKKGEIRITSDDPVEPTHVVDLNGNFSQYSGHSGGIDCNTTGLAPGKPIWLDVLWIMMLGVVFLYIRNKKYKEIRDQG